MSSFSRPGFLRPDVLWACRRFPVVVAASALLTGWLVASSLVPTYASLIPFSEGQIVDTTLVACLAAVTAGFATMRSGVWRRLAAQAAALALALAAGIWLDPREPSTALFPLALLCSVPLAAGLAVRSGVSGFWLANARLAGSLAAGLIALGIVAAGAGLILASVQQLLGILTWTLLKVLWIVAACFALPVFCLSLVHLDEADLADGQNNLLLRVVATTTDTLLVPLMLVFGAVIHVYAARIAVWAELPKGQIGWIVPTFLAIGYGVFVLTRGPGAWLPRLRAAFCRLWLPGTLVPVVLLAIAVAIRVQAYGVTEQRYLLVLVAVAGIVLPLSLLVRRPFDIRLIPAVAGILALVAAIGPLSAVNVSIGSQTSRARAILASVPPERWTVPGKSGLSDEQKKALVAAVQVLARQDPDLGMLAPAWPALLPKKPWKLEAALGTPNPLTSFRFRESGVTHLQAATLLREFYLHQEAESHIVSEDDSSSFALALKKTILEVAGENATTRFDLSALLMLKRSDPLGQNRVIHSTEGRKGDLIVLEFDRVQTPEGPDIRYLRGRIVLY